jgi:hypothetical protein
MKYMTFKPSIKSGHINIQANGTPEQLSHHAAGGGLIVHYPHA